MNSAICVDNATHFTNLKTEGRIFEWLLHLTPAENSQVTTILSRAAVRLLCCDLLPSCLPTFDNTFELVELGDRLILRRFSDYVSLRILPRRRSTRTRVLDQDVCCTNFRHFDKCCL